MYAEAASIDNDDVRKNFVKFVKLSESHQRIKAMINLAESELGIPVQPDNLDQDDFVINCKNGIVDLSTGKLFPHDKSKLLTKIIFVNYDENADCPQWKQFINDIMGDSIELVRFLQKAIGYSLTGETSEQAFFILYGMGANGKSTFLNTINDLLNDYATETSPDTFATKDRGNSYSGDIADLKDVRFVATPEFNNGKSLNEVVVKQLTGGDRMKARHHYEDEFSFKPKFKIWMSANNKPYIRENANAIWRRIRLIPFLQSFYDPMQAEYVPGAKIADPSLTKKLKDEYPGILRWAVEGCVEWQREGLGLPTEIKIANSSYKNEMDLLGDFINEKCVLQPGARVAISDLFKNYCSYCEQNGDKQLGKRVFNSILRERGLKDIRGHANVMIWTGIGLVNNINNEEQNNNEPKPKDDPKLYYIDDNDEE
jgi:putative DNA primase/helicase